MGWVHIMCPGSPLPQGSPKVRSEESSASKSVARCPLLGERRRRRRKRRRRGDRAASSHGDDSQDTPHCPHAAASCSPARHKPVSIT